MRFMAVMWLLGGLLAWWLTGLGARRAGAGKEEAGAAQDIIPNLALGGILGAKLAYVLLDPLSYVRSPGLLIVFPFGPLALPAGLVGAAAAVAWGLRGRKDWLRLLDHVAAPLAAGLAVALVGWKAPGSWAFAPLVAVAAAAAGLTRSRAAATVVLVAGALALADQARPAGAISPLQVAAAVAGTAAWYWHRKKDSGA